MEVLGSEEDNMLQYEKTSSATSYNGDKLLAVLSITEKYMSTSDSLHIQIALDEVFSKEELNILATDIAQFILQHQADS
jgi:hypothetical protein